MVRSVGPETQQTKEEQSRQRGFRRRGAPAVRHVRPSFWSPEPSLAAEADATASVRTGRSGSTSQSWPRPHHSHAQLAVLTCLDRALTDVFSRCLVGMNLDRFADAAQLLILIRVLLFILPRVTAASFKPGFVPRSVSTSVYADAFGMIMSPTDKLTRRGKHSQVVFSF